MSDAAQIVTTNIVNIRVAAFFHVNGSGRVGIAAKMEFSITSTQIFHVEVEGRL
jgi:hypothetical protein